MSVREYQRQMPLGGGLGTKLSARLHLDAPLLTALLLLVLGGLAVLYSAGGGDLNLVVRQSIRLGAGFLVLRVPALVDRERRARGGLVRAAGAVPARREQARARVSPLAGFPQPRSLTNRRTCAH